MGYNKGMIKVLKEVSKDDLYNFLYNIDISDNKLYEEINSLNYLNIFQFSGATAERVVKEIHPDNFEELVVINSCARPGTIDFVPDYVKAKYNGYKKYPEVVNKVLEKTRGICIYQEQVMMLFNKIGGFTLEETNAVRATMKKLGKADKKKEDIEKWEGFVSRFIKGAINIGITKEEAERIADDLLKLSNYSFNRSHAVAYTYNAIMTLYLTVYFREYYYAATLTYLNQNKKDDLMDAITRVKQHGIEVLPPDINSSNKEFTPVSKTQIRFGLMDIKFVGETPVASIIEKRPYRSFFDFFIRAVKPNSGINQRVIQALISTGCFDTLEPSRKKLLYIMDEFFTEKKSIKVEERLLALYQMIERKANALELNDSQLDFINYEKEYFDYNFFHSYFTDALKEKLYKAQRKGLIDLGFDELFPKASKRIAVILNSMRPFVDKNGNDMVFVEFEDMYGRKESMPIFASIYKAVRDKFKVNSIYVSYFHLNEEEKVMFGINKWLDTDEQKNSMIKELVLKE